MDEFELILAIIGAIALFFAGVSFLCYIYDELPHRIWNIEKQLEEFQHKYKR